MSQLNGHFFDGRSASRRAVLVSFTDPGYLVIQELGAQQRFPLEQVQVRPRVSDQAAVVELPGNARLEVADADAFYLELEDRAGKFQWQHKLESRWPAIAAVLLMTVAFAWLVYAQGVPFAAKWIARAMPYEVSQAISTQSLQALDGGVFTPSTLKPERRQRIRAAMEEVIRTVGDDGRYMLQFRDGNQVGANAYAFPSGLIIFTDDLVRLAESTDELRAIMAHEVGHVRNQHTLRILLQKSLLAGVTVLITGDAAAVASVAAALPKALLDAGFTREFETQADSVAKEYLLATGKPLTVFADIMSRIAAQSADQPQAHGLLKTHPAAEDRVKTFLD